MVNCSSGVFVCMVWFLVMGSVCSWVLVGV